MISITIKGKNITEVKQNLADALAQLVNNANVHPVEMVVSKRDPLLITVPDSVKVRLDTETNEATPEEKAKIIEEIKELQEKPKRTRKKKEPVEEAAIPESPVLLGVAAPPPPVPLVPPAALNPMLVEPVVAPPPVPLMPPLITDKYTFTYDMFKGKVAFVLNDLINDGKIDKTYLDSLKEYFEVKEIWEIFKSEAKVQELYVNLADFGLITKA